MSDKKSERKTSLTSDKDIRSEDVLRDPNVEVFSETTNQDKGIMKKR
jgi:hypothetical protein